MSSASPCISPGGQVGKCIRFGHIKPRRQEFHSQTATRNTKATHHPGHREPGSSGTKTNEAWYQVVSSWKTGPAPESILRQKISAAGLRWQRKDLLGHVEATASSFLLIDTFFIVAPTKSTSWKYRPSLVQTCLSLFKKHTA